MSLASPFLSEMLMQVQKLPYDRDEHRVHSYITRQMACGQFSQEKRWLHVFVAERLKVDFDRGKK